MKNKILTVVFCVMLAAAAVIIWLPADEDSVAQENRAVAKMPSTDAKTIFSGEFSSGFEDYIGDNVGFRGFFTGISGDITANKGFTSDLGKIVSVNKDVGTETTQKSRLLIAGNKIMEVFEGKKENMDGYLNVLKFYADKLDEDINFYSMLVPTQLEFQEPLYSNIQDSQKETIEYIYGNMPDRITPVDAYSELEEHKDEYIYYRTDHHWTARGAFYGYTAFMDALKKNDRENEKMYKPVTIEEFPANKTEGFLGYLYKQAQTPELKDDPDTIEWYDLNEQGHISISDEYYENGKGVKYDSVIFAKDKNDYSLFLGGDQPLVEMTNSANPKGRTILIIKDSYCNCFAPWVIQNYHKVVLIDPRTYEGGLQQLLERYKPDDLLLMNYIFTTTFSDYCQMTIDFFDR
jgi:hypothetical protein